MKIITIILQIGGHKVCKVLGNDDYDEKYILKQRLEETFEMSKETQMLYSAPPKEVVSPKMLQITGENSLAGKKVIQILGDGKDDAKVKRLSELNETNVKYESSSSMMTSPGNGDLYTSSNYSRSKYFSNSSISLLDNISNNTSYSDSKYFFLPDETINNKIIINENEMENVNSKVLQLTGVPALAGDKVTQLLGDGSGDALAVRLAAYNNVDISMQTQVTYLYIYIYIYILYKSARSKWRKL